MCIYKSSGILQFKQIVIVYEALVESVINYDSSPWKGMLRYYNRPIKKNNAQ